jgi:bifunctional DNA-binding transcriptional regulator/antitoxin component of YhaV-PrlF toxin-antitoxin module
LEFVRLKEKGQFTLPASIREKILAQTGDLFLFTVEGNRVVMEPQEVSTRTQSAASSRKKGVDIGPWIGAAKGAFANVAEADDFVRAERGQWE